VPIISARRHAATIGDNGVRDEAVGFVACRLAIPYVRILVDEFGGSYVDIGVIYVMSSVPFYVKTEYWYFFRAHAIGNISNHVFYLLFFLAWLVRGRGTPPSSI
jgi:hypothetical protein